MEAPSMTKIGKLLSVFLVLFISVAYSPVSVAQDVQVEASLSETNIFSDEQVSLSLTISGNSLGSIRQPDLPEIEGLRWLRGTTSRSSKYSIINGTPSVSLTFTYALQAQSPGNYQVPPIPVNIEGTTYQTDPINFTILNPADVESEDAVRTPDIYLRLEPSTQNPVVGQQIITDVVLYFKNGIDVSSYQPTPGWKAEGFWKEELDNRQRARTTSTIINGVRYQRAQLMHYALFPTKSGELTLSPFEITVTVRKQGNSTNPFFGMAQERVNVNSIPVNMDVAPLPPVENAQEIGAVGDFDITRTVTPSRAVVGESIEISTQIIGIGNVPMVNKPEYAFPEALEKYNPQEVSNIDRTGSQISGTRTFTDIVIARNEGTYIIPETNVAYFNPETESFEIENLPEIVLNVQRDPDASVLTQDNLRLNVQPITGLANWTTTASKPLYQKTWIWILILFPILSTAVAYGFKKYNDRMNTDVAFYRSRNATEKAQKTLAEAENVTSVKEGYYLIEKALVQFITDKLNLPPAGLSHQDIIQEVEKFGEPEISTELKRLLTKCETIAYAPNATQQSLNSDIEKTKALLKKTGRLSR